MMARFRRDKGPDGPTDVGRGGWWAVLKRTVQEFRDDNLSDWAAALTYYGVLAIFPALIVLTSVLGLIGESATKPLLDELGNVAPGPANDILTSAIKNLQGDQGAAGVLFVVGLLAALWSASSYVAAFMRASNVIYEVEEGRSVFKLRPLQMAVTLVLVLVLALVLAALVLTGPVAQQVGSAIGVGDAAVTIWDIAKWPVLLVAVLFMIGLLYYASPNAKLRGFRWITPGSVLAIAVWLAASAGFAFYVANFGSYSKTYGALGGVIVFLVWLWLTNVAILLGAELNAEHERSRELEDGVPGAERELQLDHRSEPTAKQRARTA